MFFNVRRLLTYNYKTLVKFELLYKLLSFAILKPLLTLFFKIIMNVNGYSYLTFENVKEFMSNPSTLLMILFFLLVLMIFVLFEAINIIVILDASRQKIKIDLKESLKISLKKSLKILRFNNIGLILFVLFLIPFINLGVSSSYLSVIKIPEFIMDYIKANPLYFTVYILFMVLLFYLFFNWIYSINYMVLENKSFHKAHKLSNDLYKKSSIKDFLKILLIEAFQYLAYVIFVAIGILLIVLIHKLINGSLVLNSLLTTIVWIFLAISFILFNLISVPTSYAAISYLYYSHKLENGEELSSINIKNTVDKKEKKNNSKFNKIKYIVIFIILIAGTIYTYGINKGNYKLSIKKSVDIRLTAHRGASKYYPENTLAAFIGAKKEGADVIELDVQATKDNYIVVIHDSNLKRVTGLDKNIWEVTYDEIKDLDFGSFYDVRFKNEHIMLLSEVIDWAIENNIDLNIEIKPTGHENNIEKEVVNIINDKEFVDNCVVTSGKYDSIKKVKKYNKKIKTIYVMSLAYGDIISLKEADGFSIESTSISKNLVKKIHKNNKVIFAWTVNNSSNINKMIKLGVDSIITDDIIYTKDLINDSKSSNVIFEYISFIDELF